MNKPIRTVSIFCLILFLALMINATYLQYWKAGALNDDPRNPLRDMGSTHPNPTIEDEVRGPGE